MIPPTAGFKLHRKVLGFAKFKQAFHPIAIDDPRGCTLSLSSLLVSLVTKSSGYGCKVQPAPRLESVNHPRIFHII